MKENIIKLTLAITNKSESEQDANDICDFVYDTLGDFTKYFNKVYDNVVKVSMATTMRAVGRIDQEKFEFIVKTSDTNRRLAHETAIDACNKLNRICDRFGVERFCPDPNISDRYQIADFIGEFVYQIYQEGQSKEPSKTLDQSIKNAETKGLEPERGYSTNVRKVLNDGR